MSTIDQWWTRRNRRVTLRYIFVLTSMFAAAILIHPPSASAQPPNCIGPPGATTTVWCGPTMPTGQHMRCQWMFLFNSCDWRWDDDSPAPTP